MPFAQLVIGPPGSGKSTYCDGMQQFLAAVERPCAVVNLDPANDRTSYPAALDVRDLVTLDDIMESEALGPNGGVLYALEELEHNFEWLEEGLKQLGDDYILFDCPGQVELFTHHDSLRNVFSRLQKLGYRLVVLHLIDSFALTQPSLYVSSLLLSLRSMLQLDLPHLNVLTKIDNLASHGPLPLPLDFYTDASGLEYLLPYLDEEMSRHPLPDAVPRERQRVTPTSTARRRNIFDTSASDYDESLQPVESHQPTASKFAALNAAIVDLVSDYALVGFETLCVEDRDSMRALLMAIDRASGFAVSDTKDSRADVWRMAAREPTQMSVRDVEERWVTRRASFDAAERAAWAAEGRLERGETAKTTFRRRGGQGEETVQGDEAMPDREDREDAEGEDELPPVRRLPRELHGRGGVVGAEDTATTRRAAPP